MRIKYQPEDVLQAAWQSRKAQLSQANSARQAPELSGGCGFFHSRGVTVTRPQSDSLRCNSEPPRDNLDSIWHRLHVSWRMRRGSKQANHACRSEVRVCQVTTGLPHCI